MVYFILGLIGIFYAWLKLDELFGSNTYVDRRGYKRFSDSNKPVHRWAASKRIGRPLRDGEVAHHINRDKQDNRPSNLWVFKSQKEHDRAHKRDADRFGKSASYRGFDD